MAPVPLLAHVKKNCLALGQVFQSSTQLDNGRVIAIAEIHVAQVAFVIVARVLGKTYKIFPHFCQSIMALSFQPAEPSGADRADVLQISIMMAMTAMAMTL